MKRVNFEIAKALKEAGYPQGQEDYAYRSNGEIYVFENFFDHISDYCCDAPFVMEAWLWLWREKKVCIDIFVVHNYNALVVINDELQVFNDPEEAIIAAIEYLVENKLLK